MRPTLRFSPLGAAAVVVAALGVVPAASAQLESSGTAKSGAASSSDTSQAPRARSHGLRPPKIVVSPKAHEMAARLTKEAQQHYDAGELEQAAESYRRAYAVVPAPELLFNLGQCQRLLGRPQRAVKYFESYLRLRPDAPQRPLVEQLISESKLIAPPPVPRVPQSAPAIGLEEHAAPSAPSPAHHEAVMPLPPPEPLPESAATRVGSGAFTSSSSEDSPAIYERWWFWTAIAVVAAGAAVTTYAIVESQSDSEPSTTLGMVAWD